MKLATDTPAVITTPDIVETSLSSLRGDMRRYSFLHVVLAVSAGLAIMLANGPASAKTVAECKQEYAANRKAIEARARIQRLHRSVPSKWRV